MSSRHETLRQSEESGVIARADAQNEGLSTRPQKRRRAETITDDGSQGQALKIQCESGISGETTKLSPVRSVAEESKKLQPVPANAPRDMEKWGRFTFIKGVRIRDYQFPTPKSPTPRPQSRQYQCRDSFDGSQRRALGSPLYPGRSNQVGYTGSLRNHPPEKKGDGGL